MSDSSNQNIRLLGTQLSLLISSNLTCINHTDHIIKLNKGHDLLPSTSSTSSPSFSKLRLVTNDGETINRENYQSLIGQLQYISNTTRPDITYCVNSLSRFANNPGRAHWDAAKRAISYVSSTHNLSIGYAQGNPDTKLKLTAYSDADWAGDSDCYSIGGSVIQLNGSPVMWTSKKLKIIAMSSAKSEFISAATTY
jgi:hypothetical protein